MNGEERAQKIEDYGNSYDQLRQILTDCPREMWQFKPGADSWSVQEVLVHLTDIEANNYVRYRTVATKPGQIILGVDADTWAGAFDYQKQDVDECLELFRLLRASNARLLKSLPDSAWSNPMQHTERGEITLEQLFELQTNHLNNHLNQIHTILSDWKS